MTDRSPNPSDPTAERTSEQSTPDASGLSGGRPDMEQGRRDDGDELIPREGEDSRDRAPAMPDDDTSRGTKI